MQLVWAEGSEEMGGGGCRGGRGRGKGRAPHRVPDVHVGPGRDQPLDLRRVAPSGGLVQRRASLMRGRGRRRRAREGVLVREAGCGD
jgi:hypothetical protein